MKQPCTHFLLLLLFISCLCLDEIKKRTQKRTNVVKKKRWKIRTTDVGLKENGKDHQEDDVNGGSLCSYLIAQWHKYPNCHFKEQSKMLKEVLIIKDFLKKWRKEWIMVSQQKRQETTRRTKKIDTLIPIYGTTAKVSR